MGSSVNAADSRNLKKKFWNRGYQSTALAMCSKEQRKLNEMTGSSRTDMSHSCQTWRWVHEI